MVVSGWAGSFSSLEADREVEASYRPDVTFTVLCSLLGTDLPSNPSHDQVLEEPSVLAQVLQDAGAEAGLNMPKASVGQNL